MTEQKKRAIRKIFKEYRDLLGLHEYRIYTRFKRIKEDKDLKDALAIIIIDNAKKILYLKLRPQDFHRMKLREIKRYLLHELLHSIFAELSAFFEHVLEQTHFSEGRKRILLNKFDEMEHKKINYLIPLMYRFVNGKHA